MTDFDVIVIGGGPAGLSAAVALGRALRAVLVVDAGEPRNAPADGIHNYLTRDGVPPGEFGALGRAEVKRYGGEVIDGRAVRAERAGDGWRVHLDGGPPRTARRLLVAGGVTDELPGIPGLRERWGRTVLHCPYCHGYEVRGRAIGVLGSAHGVQQALHWCQWTDDLVLFQPGGADPRLDARGIRVVETPVRAIGDDGVHLADGTVVARDALVAASRLAPVPVEGLDFDLVEGPQGLAVATVDPMGRTALPGVWVAGNAADPVASVAASAAAGFNAAVAINVDLITAETDHLMAASSR